jgi:hypothetical protein
VPIAGQLASDPGYFDRHINNPETKITRGNNCSSSTVKGKCSTGSSCEYDDGKRGTMLAQASVRRSLVLGRTSVESTAVAASRDSALGKGPDR